MVMTEFFFMQRLYFQRFSFPLHGFLNKNHEFFGNVQNRFPLNTSQARATYFKKCVAVFRVRGCLHRLFSALRSRIIDDNNFTRHDCAPCRP